MENRIYYGEYSLKHWIELILKKNIIIPEYQRYFVWEEEDVKKLIDALKKQLFVPPVTIGAFKIEDVNQNLIIDGQQRLTSILLAYLGLYPDENEYKRTIERFANENDDEIEEDEQLDNIYDWKFSLLIEKGNNKEEILSRIVQGNYKNVDYDITNDFWDQTFLGFSYLVPYLSDEKQQQKYYSSVFRNINIQGTPLLPQESREALYFLDNDLKLFFKPDFSNDYTVKILSTESKIDFVRYLSLLSQYKTDNNINKVARSYKSEMEKYYEEYIDAVISDNQSKYGKFTTMFPNKEYSECFTNLKNTLTALAIPQQFPSMIDMDMYFFGIIHVIIFEKKSIDCTKQADLQSKIEEKIREFKQDISHTKSPSNLGHLRRRIITSIEIYEDYAS